jgi:hypothetical protein
MRPPESEPPFDRAVYPLAAELLATRDVGPSGFEITLEAIISGFVRLRVSPEQTSPTDLH